MEEKQNEQNNNQNQDKAEEYLNGWKRAKADFDNYKKEESKRFTEIIKFSNEALIKDLLLVLESLDLAISSLKNDDKGFYMIKSQLEEILKNNGLEKMIIAVGQKFDPALQEAIAVVDSDKESGIVIEEVASGYLLNGKLIKSAKVKVSK